MAAAQHWDLSVPAAEGVVGHHVSVRPDGWSRVVAWTVDGTLVAEKKSGDETVRLTDPQGTHGAVRVTFSMLGAPRRATWFSAGEAAALAGFGGIDLDPEPGSKAALREDRMRAHPRRYAARHVAVGVAQVVVPLLVTLLIARFAVRIDWPDWNLPNLRVPRLPDVLPDPDLPDWEVPGWAAAVLEKVKFLIPVLIGLGVALAELRRRRAQDRIKAELNARRVPDESDSQGEGGPV